MENEAAWKVAYWAFAWALLAAAAVSGSLGWRAIRQEKLERHARLMNQAVILIVLFLVSYPIKLALLGREDLGTWSEAARVMLRSHEAAVAVMLIAGGLARWLARRFGKAGRNLADASMSDRSRHRRLGRAALVMSFVGLGTAAAVLVGMILRLP